MARHQNDNLTISAVIPTYHRYECLEAVLDALSVQSHPLYEVIVVDQTPISQRPDGFYEKYDQLPLVLINQDTPSLTTSRNKGAEAANGQLLLFIDDDMALTPGLVEAHAAVFQEERVDVVSGAVSSAEEMPKTCLRDTKRLDPISFFLKTRKHDWSGMTLVISGANTLIKRDLFLKVGGFDENIPRMEDIDLGYRLFLSGAKLFHSTIPFAQHKHWRTGGTRKSQKDLPYYRLVSKIYIYKKHFPGWTTRQFLLREIISALLYREYVSGKFRPRFLLQPYLPLLRIIRMWQASLDADRRLAKAHARATTPQ